MSNNERIKALENQLEKVKAQVKMLESELSELKQFLFCKEGSKNLQICR
jgi:prefoldin subunit 5